MNRESIIKLHRQIDYFLKEYWDELNDDDFAALVKAQRIISNKL